MSIHDFTIANEELDLIAMRNDDSTDIQDIVATFTHRYLTICAEESEYEYEYVG